MRLGKMIVAVVMVALFSACGSDSSSSSGESTNNAPTVNAGVDKSVRVNETISLVGVANDSDGSIVAYEWREGNKFLTNTQTLDYLPTIIGGHTITLTVTDNDGATASDNMTVMVVAEGAVVPTPVSTPIPVVSSSSLSDGLIAHYEFEGNAKDSSGNGNDGTEHGGVTYVDGVIGKAGSFDGVDDYINITPKSDVSNITDFTISVWTRVEEKSFIRQYIFDGKSGLDDYRNDGFYLIYDIDNNLEEIHNGTISNSKDIESKVKFSLQEKWIEMIYMRKNGQYFIYIDNIKLDLDFAHNELTDESLDMQHNWFIGTFFGNNPKYYSNTINNYSYKGKIDDLRIYNRALNETEIQELYNLKQ